MTLPSLFSSSSLSRSCCLCSPSPVVAVPRLSSSPRSSLLSLPRRLHPPSPVVAVPRLGSSRWPHRSSPRITRFALDDPACPSRSHTTPSLHITCFPLRSLPPHELIPANRADPILHPALSAS